MASQEIIGVLTGRNYKVHWYFSSMILKGMGRWRVPVFLMQVVGQ
jgi:hypothetical protein